MDHAEEPKLTRVLVADSHVTVRRAWRRLLADEPGLNLAGEVTRASDLLPRARQIQPDVVLLEWELPGMAADGSSGNSAALPAGRWLLYRLHALPSHPYLVVLSGWPEAQQVAAMAGADAFLSKSGPPEQVIATLRMIGREHTNRRRWSQRSIEEAQSQGVEAAMNVKNYHNVKAEQQEPGITLRRLTSGRDEPPNFALKLYELAPNTISPVHTHIWEDEVFVLKGKGALVGPEGEVQIDEGDVIYIPPSERHQFVNKGKGELSLLITVPNLDQVTLAGGTAEQAFSVP